MRTFWRRAAGALYGRLYEPVTLGATLLALAALYGVYSSVKRSYDVTSNALQFRDMEQKVEASTKELEQHAERFRRQAQSEPDLLRAEKMRKLADEADAMRVELRRLANALEEAKVEYKNAENLNTFLNAFGGKTGSLLGPVLDQAFEFKAPGEAASVSIGDYFDKKLGAPIEPALQRELTTRLFQVTLERAFRSCGVTSDNLGSSVDCVGTELLNLNNKLAQYEGRNENTEKVRELIKKSLGNEELKRLLKNRLAGGDFAIDPEPDQADAGADAGAPNGPEDWPGRWSGMVKVALTGGEINVTTRSRMEVDVRQQGSQIRIVPIGEKSQPLELTLTPSNPNAASGKTDSKSTIGNALVGGSAELDYKLTAFVRDGRLYLAIQGTGQAEGHAADTARKDQLTTSMIGIFDRVD